MSTEQDRDLFLAINRAEQEILKVTEIVTRGMDPAVASIYGSRVHALMRALLDELKGGPTLEIVRRAAEDAPPVKPPTM